jgi:hypothetical protein
VGGDAVLAQLLERLEGDQVGKTELGTALAKAALFPRAQAVLADSQNPSDISSRVFLSRLRHTHAKILTYLPRVAIHVFEARITRCVCERARRPAACGKVASGAADRWRKPRAGCVAVDAPGDVSAARVALEIRRDERAARVRYDDLFARTEA